MISIKVDGLGDIQKQLARMPRQAEIACQRALLRIADHIRLAERAEMERVFDRPTRWTLNAMKVKATGKMEVSVGIIDTEGAYKRAQSYLGVQASGSNRKYKAMERALQARGIMPHGTFIVPGAGAKLDAYGNIATGEIRQILSWFDAAEMWAGSTQNMGTKGRAKRRKGTKKARGFEYVAFDGRGRARHLHQGIYRRTFFGLGSAIKPILMFVRKAKYQARFDFERVARETYDKHASNEINASLARELFK